MLLRQRENPADQKQNHSKSIVCNDLSVWNKRPQPRPQGFSIKKWVGREKAPPIF